MINGDDFIRPPGKGDSNWGTNPDSVQPPRPAEPNPLAGNTRRDSDPFKPTPPLQQGSNAFAVPGARDPFTDPSQGNPWASAAAQPVQPPVNPFVTETKEYIYVPVGQLSHVDSDFAPAMVRSPHACTAGRGSDCSLKLDGADVSRNHATMWMTVDGILLRDDGATNHTWYLDNYDQGRGTTMYTQLSNASIELKAGEKFKFDRSSPYEYTVVGPGLIEHRRRVFDISTGAVEPYRIRDFSKLHPASFQLGLPGWSAREIGELMDHLMFSYLQAQVGRKHTKIKQLYNTFNMAINNMSPAQLRLVDNLLSSPIYNRPEAARATDLLNDFRIALATRKDYFSRNR